MREKMNSDIERKRRKPILRFKKNGREKGRQNLCIEILSLFFIFTLYFLFHSFLLILFLLWYFVILKWVYWVYCCTAPFLFKKKLSVRNVLFSITEHYFGFKWTVYQARWVSTSHIPVLYCTVYSILDP